MILQRNEKLVPLGKLREVLAEIFENDEDVPCGGTIRNWVNKGQRGIVLETVWVGKKGFTSRAAVMRFLNSVSERRKSQRNHLSSAAEVKTD